MDTLRTTISQIMPLLVREWNEIKLPLFEQLVEQKFSDYFQGRQTQEKTKMVAPILDSIFARQVRTLLPTFCVTERAAQDYMYDTTPMECKITFGAGNTWSGNGYNKTPWHILLRFGIQDDGQIDRAFAALVNLDQTVSQWQSASRADAKTVNWYKLNFIVEDLDHIQPILGTLETKNKYIQPIMVDIKSK